MILWWWSGYLLRSPTESYFDLSTNYIHTAASSGFLSSFLRLLPASSIFYDFYTPVKSVHWIDPFAELEMVNLRVFHEDLQILEKDRSSERIYHGNKKLTIFKLVIASEWTGWWVSILILRWIWSLEGSGRVWFLPDMVVRDYFMISVSTLWVMQPDECHSESDVARFLLRWLVWTEEHTEWVEDWTLRAFLEGGSFYTSCMKISRVAGFSRRRGFLGLTHRAPF